MRVPDEGLLSEAARAIGHEVHFNKVGACQLTKDGEYVRFWNPLTIDSDAFRLMVDLGIGVCSGMPFPLVGAFSSPEDNFIRCRETALCGDLYAATRRAIVRVAAEIGRRMQNETNPRTS